MSIVKLKNPLTKNYIELKNTILGNNFPWFWDNQVEDFEDGEETYKDTRYDNFPIYFHSFLYRPTPECFYSRPSSYCDIVHSVVVEILKYNNIGFDVIYRMSANCTHPTDKNLCGPIHTDHNFSHKNIIVYLNNFEGGSTWCEGKTYNGKEDDIITFEGNHNFYPPLKDRRIVLVATYEKLDKKY
jgi:hypothetical protein